MDERLNLTPLQINLIQKMVEHNECRVGYISKNKSVILVLYSLLDQLYLAYEIDRKARTNLLTVFPESYSSFAVFNQLPVINGHDSFASLFTFHKEDKLLSKEDLRHFSCEQLSSLCDIAVDELLRRSYVRDFIREKIEHSRELFEEAYKESVRRFEEIVAEARRSIEKEEIDLSPWNS